MDHEVKSFDGRVFDVKAFDHLYAVEIKKHAGEAEIWIDGTPRTVRKDVDLKPVEAGLARRRLCCQSTGVRPQGHLKQ